MSQLQELSVTVDTSQALAAIKELTEAVEVLTSKFEALNKVMLRPVEISTDGASLRAVLNIDDYAPKRNS